MHPTIANAYIVTHFAGSMPGKHGGVNQLIIPLVSSVRTSGTAQLRRITILPLYKHGGSESLRLTTFLRLSTWPFNHLDDNVNYGPFWPI